MQNSENIDILRILFQLLLDQLHITHSRKGLMSQNV